ncbi:putative ribonuclease H-like domain-containing protein, partial [Tanacetum coccineum]
HTNKSEDDSSPKEVYTAGQHVNTASSKVNTGRFKLNTVDPSVNIASLSNLDSPKDMFIIGASHTLKATHVEFFSDEDEPKVDLGNILNSYIVPTTPNIRIHKDHLIKNVIGDVKSSVQTRRMTKATYEQGFLSAVYKEKTHDTLNTCLYACFLSQIEPTSIAKALSDSSWVEAMQEELFQFKLQQGHKQEEGIDYEEVFALVEKIKAIRLFLAYASFMGFLVYQMDVKSAFLYGTIEEEVYVTQPSGFKDPDHPNKVYKVVKALYGLHQAPKAWYETLANYLLGNGFQRGKNDQTLFIKRQKGDILLLQIYVDDIIFGSTNKELCTGFEKLMKDKFQMSSIGELTFFLGLQVGDEAVHRELGDRMERAATTTSSLEAEQDSVELIASIDGHVKTITEASLRRHLKLEDNDGVTSLPNLEIFEQLALMGYETDSDNLTFQKDEGMTWFQDTYAELKEKTSDETELVLEEQEPNELVEDQGSGEKSEKEVTTPINLQTYIRRRSGVSTASRLDSTADISTASEIGSTTGVKAKDKEAVRLQEQINEKERQRIARDVEVAKQLQEDINKAGQERVVAEDDQAHVIDWSDPSVIRYHALKIRPRFIAEVRKNICIYLKNHGGYKMKDLKGMSYDDIRPIFESKTETKQVEEEIIQQRDEQKLEDDAEKEELQVYLYIVPKDEGLDDESLATKADGSVKHYKIFSAMLYDFDRQDVLELYRLVKERFQTASPEGYDLLLWGDLMTMLEPNDEDDIWKNQQD